MMHESNFGKRWVHSAKNGRGSPMLYHRIGPNSWRSYHLDGNDGGAEYSDMDILVFLSNKAYYIKAPAFAKKKGLPD